MGKPKINKKAETINIKADSKKEFFLLHGYTGSPTDFNNLGKYLNKRFNANVKIIRLKGHGERIENIDNLKYHNFLLQAEKELKKDLKKGREIVIGGVSIGSFIALQLSTKYPVKGILNISVPYKYKFFTSIVAFLEPLIPKKHWKKPIPKYQKELRKNSFYYDVSLLGFRVIKDGKRELNNILDKVTAPCLIIHVAKEKIFHIAGVKFVKERINSKICELYVFKETGRAGHNPFYSENHDKLYKIIGNFVEKNKLFTSK